MRKDKEKELEQFKVATLQLLANKLFVEFMTANEKFHVEPEHFFEDWVIRNVCRPDDQLKIWTWRYFMENLIAFRKFHK